MKLQDPTVYRVVGIPHLVATNDLKSELVSKFADEDKGIWIQATIAPACSSHDDTYVALVSFLPRDPSYLAPLVGDDDEVSIDTGVGKLTFDKHFSGLTQLYPTIPGFPIAADIVAVAGLDGHAYDSWRAGNMMWLHNFLDNSLPSCRTMIYGYDSNLRSTTCTHTLKDYQIGLLLALVMARRSLEDQGRPIIFIGYGIGGIIIAQCLVSAANAIDHDDPMRYSIFKATHAVMFFNTPHRGLSTENIPDIVEGEEHRYRDRLVKSVHSSSQELQSQLETFIGIVAAGKFQIFSFYPTIKPGKWVEGRNGRYVFTPDDTDSPVLDLPGGLEVVIPVDEDHHDIVKFSSPMARVYRATVLGYLYTLTDDLVLKSSGYLGTSDTALEALRSSIATGYERLLRLLLDKVEDPYGTEIEVPLLHLALVQGNVAFMWLLLDKGAPIDAQNHLNDDRTALHLAAHGGHERITHILHRSGADIEAKSRSGETALHLAAQSGHESIVRWLLETGADIEAKTTLQETALHLASRQGHEAIVRLLLEKGASSETEGDHGTAGLHLVSVAAVSGFSAPLRLEKDADKAATLD